MNTERIREGTVTTWTECPRCGKNSERSMEFSFASERAPRHLWTAFPCPQYCEPALLHMRRLTTSQILYGI